MSAEERVGPPQAGDLLVDAGHHLGRLESTQVEGLLRYTRHERQGQARIVADGIGCELFVPRERAVAAVAEVTRERDFYARRCEALQRAQRHMRDPEREVVCDVLANGTTWIEPFRASLMEVVHGT